MQPVPRAGDGGARVRDGHVCHWPAVDVLGIEHEQSRCALPAVEAERQYVAVILGRRTLARLKDRLAAELVRLGKPDLRARRVFGVHCEHARVGRDGLCLGRGGAEDVAVLHAAYGGRDRRKLDVTRRQRPLAEGAGGKVNSVARESRALNVLLEVHLLQNEALPAGLAGVDIDRRVFNHETVGSYLKKRGGQG
eukprot:4999498-Pleurochrysis_carterae.AAC.12